MKEILLEVCATTPQSVVSAAKGGARRVELCSALEVGGVTPAPALIAMAKSVKGLQIHVLIRPRGGDFCYTDKEKRCIIQDIQEAKRLGADGVVVGALLPDGQIDSSFTRDMRMAAQGMSVTFHRAFDVCAHPKEALEQLIHIGCDRILTSGLHATALEGVQTLKALAAQADGRIIILAGCGINSQNVREIIRLSGVSEIHASAKKFIKSPMTHHNPHVLFGKTVEESEGYWETNQEEVLNITKALKGFSINI